jgi:hypothetical protein
MDLFTAALIPDIYFLEGISMQGFGKGAFIDLLSGRK